MRNKSYYPNYDNYLVGDKLLNSNGYTATTFENIKALFDKAEVGDVVQMYWDTGVTYSSQHTVIVSATDKANNKVWFLHSNWWPDFKTPQITNTGFSYSTITDCCTKAHQKAFNSKGTIMYGGISLYRFSGTIPPEPEPLPEGSVRIDEEHFPDEIFRNDYVRDDFDTNKDGILSAEEAASVHDIQFVSSVTNLKGIEYFTALTTLVCHNNQLTELDVSGNIALTYLDCESNQLTELDVSKNTALTELACSYNQLTTLDVSNNTALTQLF